MVSLRKRAHPDSGSLSVEQGVNSESAPKTDVAPSDIDEFSKAGPSGCTSSAVGASLSPPVSGRKKKQLFCLCKGQDDGRPMVRCEGACDNWYHFECVGLSEDAAGEIEQYFCPTCAANTGIHSIMDYEGQSAYLQPNSLPKMLKSRKGRLVKLRSTGDSATLSSEASADDGSEDDYVDESANNRKGAGKRISRRLSSSEESEGDADSDSSRHKHNAKRTKKIKPLQVSKAMNRQHQPVSSQIATTKPKLIGSAQDDALRKFCLTKLEEILTKIFEEYEKEQPKAGEGDTAAESIPEKPAPAERAKAFAAELEHCMMDKYGEPDKTGKMIAHNKYKERLRMFQFNLPKPDRVGLRRGIATERIKPEQLNVMSSTDLADEHTKHEIEQAEKEALEHSILQKITAPRAKITHKGFEAIEDFSGQRASDSREEEERMDMEKRERERQARLRKSSVNQEGSPFTPIEPSPLSGTLPALNSPTTSTNMQQTWSLPATASPNTAGPSFARNVVRPLFVPSFPNGPVDTNATDEGGLNFSDLIDLDGAEKRNSPTVASRQGSDEPAREVTNEPAITSPSGPSPFAPSHSHSSNFDLGSFWNNNGGTDSNLAAKAEDLEIQSEPEPEDQQEDAMDVDSDDNDDALDAILAQEKIPTPVETPTEQPNLKTLPSVWTGHIAMPTEKLDLLEFKVMCKQIGGQAIEPPSSLWHILFPSNQTRVDGRVPTGSSSPYLVTTRLNPQKELIAVAFTPESEEHVPKYNEFVDFFIKKDRHALVFPWGQHPKSGAPGRELYIVPLLKEHPIPEYIELLDNHQLPPERDENVLIGVFVLNKGKLAAAAPPVPAPAPTPVPTSTPPFIPSAAAPFPPSLAAFNGIGAPSSVAPSKVDQAALAAEVASLTPQQISIMLAHLSQASPQLAASLRPSLSTNPAPPPPPNVVPPHVVPPHAYAPFIPGSQHLPPPVVGASGPPHSYPPAEIPPHKPGGRDDRGRRRQRGRGRGGRISSDVGPPVDSGWRGRGRGLPSGGNRGSRY